jgi:transposase
MLLEENRALKQALVERDAQITERDVKIAELERQVARMAELEEEIEDLRARLRGAARDQARLAARLKELLARRRALAEEIAPGQLALFGLEEEPKTPPCAKEAPDGETKEDRIRPRHAPKRAPREITYEALPKEHVRHELPSEERVCQVTGKPLVAVGEKTSEELEYRPSKLVVVVHHRVLYGLCEEDREERSVEPILAPAPLRPIENALAGAGLLAWIVVQKYCHHLPLYRQQAIFARDGLLLPRQTLCDWVLASAFQLAPIVLALKRLILASGLVQLDDTPVQCQGGKGQPNFEARLWAYLSPLVSGVVFDFVPDKTHEHVLAFLGEGFEGYIVGDGYQGYGTVVKKQPAVIEAGCWAHVFRKFKDALKESPVEAARMLRLIGKLFDLESEAAQQKLEPAALLELRRNRAPPILEEISNLTTGWKGTTSDAGPLAKALTYLENQWPVLQRFLEDGRVPIHNNACENAIRPVAIGRRNWLFAGSVRGGECAATVYSLIESCRRVDVDPFVYLRDVLVRVCTHPASRVHELVPASWKELFGAGQVR